MSGFEAWAPDGTQIINATDTLGLEAGYVEIGNSSNPSGSIYHGLLTMGTPFFVYVPNQPNIKAPSINIDKNSGVITWDGTFIAGTWQGTIHFGSY